MEEKTIYLPQPDGYRRGCLRYTNGLTHVADLSPEELLQQVDAFLSDPAERWLKLHDAQYGDLYAVPRLALERDLLDVMVAWVKNPAPQSGPRPGGVLVARDLPMDPAAIAALSREERGQRRRTRRGLN